MTRVESRDEQNPTTTKHTFTALSSLSSHTISRLISEEFRLANMLDQLARGPIEIEPRTRSQTAGCGEIDPSRIHELASQNNSATQLSSTEGPNEPPSASNLVDDSGRSTPPQLLHEQDQDQESISRSQEAQLIDPYETNPDHYIPWLPRHDDAGIFIGLQTAAILTFFISGIFSTMLILIFDLNFIEHLSKTSIWDPIGFRLVSFFLFTIHSFRGVLNWMPLLVIWRVCLNRPNDRNGLGIYLKVVVCAVLFGLLCWASYALSAFTDSWKLWSVINLPNSFHGCQTRVTEQQSALFVPGDANLTNGNLVDRGIYHAQFDRIFLVSRDGSNNYNAINATLFREIHDNQTLCNNGFQGNSDYYGIGIRIGLYLQWMASLLANNFLPHTQTELQKVYLVFSLAICFATVITTFSGTCTFSIEIEILYWMYWGGYMCVFGSSPDVIAPELQVKWVQLDWTTAILFFKHWMMTYHGVWFVWYGYDQSFARMPCGTYQFLFAPLLDPSERYANVRDLLMALFLPSVGSLVLGFPIMAMLLATEFKHAVQDSALFRTCFTRHNVGSNLDNPNEGRSLSLLSRLYRRIKNIYGQIREVAGLPPYSRKGIRLIAQLDIRHRRYVTNSVKQGRV